MPSHPFFNRFVQPPGRFSDRPAILLHQLTGLSVAASLLFATYGLLSGKTYLGLINLALMPVYLVGGWLNWRGYLAVARSYIILAVCGGIFFVASTQGVRSGNVLLYIPVICGIFVLFDWHQQARMWAHILVPVVAVCTLELTNYALFITPQLRSDALASFVINVVVSVGTLWLCVNYLTRAYRATEQTLRQSQENLRSVLENTQDAIWSVDPRRRLVTFNSTFQRRFAEVTGQTLRVGDCALDYLTPDVKVAWTAIYDRAYAGEQFTEDLVITTDARVIYTEVSVNPLFDQHRVVGISFFAKDVSERRHAIERLRFHASILANVQDAVIGLDPHFKVSYWNEGAERQFGLAAEAVTGHSINDAYTIEWQHPGQETDSVQELLRTGQSRADVYLVLQNGRRLFAEVTTVLWEDNEGQTIGYLGIIRDTTARKQAEDELRRTNFELDSFVYRSSHDLRAPLRSLLGLTNLVRLEDSPEQRLLFLDLVDKCVLKLDTFIADMTDFSRNSRQDLVVSAVDFDKLIQDCAENLRYMEFAQRVQLRVEYEPTVPFYSDAQRLAIVVQNLLSNSVKYQRHDIEDARVTVRVTVSERAATVACCDNGKGIQAQYLPRIFEMFFRASADAYGSGLGLYITKQVVDKLQGDIRASSQPGEGTCFVITLPNLQPTALTDPAPQSAALTDAAPH